MNKNSVCLTVAILPVIAAVAVRPLPAQGCHGMRGDRAAAIAATYVVGEAAVAAFHPSDWWQGPPGRFQLTWVNAGGSPSAGQDYLMHIAASYQASQVAALAWDWACAPPMTAAWLGAATAFALLLPKKIVDGFHSTGFEVAKNLANAGGALLPVMHRRWPATRAVSLKAWYWPSAEFRHRTPGGEPQLLSDYAGQRYYLSINPARAGAEPSWWPRWVGVAVGHSTAAWVTESPARHEWYAVLDLELRGLPVKARWWPGLAAVLDQVHFPAPGVRLRDGRVAVGLF